PTLGRGPITAWLLIEDLVWVAVYVHDDGVVVDELAPVSSGTPGPWPPSSSRWGSSGPGRRAAGDRPGLSGKIPDRYDHPLGSRSSRGRRPSSARRWWPRRTPRPPSAGRPAPGPRPAGDRTPAR